MEIAILVILVALFMINGVAVRWYQHKALCNSSHRVKGFLFIMGLFDDPRKYNEEGKRYLKISQLLYIPAIALMVTILVLFGIYNSKQGL